MALDDTGDPMKRFEPHKPRKAPEGMWAPRKVGCKKACCFESYIGSGDVCDQCGLQEDGSYV